MGRKSMKCVGRERKMPTGNAPSHVCYLRVSQALPPPLASVFILLSFSLPVALLEPARLLPPFLQVKD